MFPATDAGAALPAQMDLMPRVRAQAQAMLRIAARCDGSGGALLLTAARMISRPAMLTRICTWTPLDEPLRKSMLTNSLRELALAYRRKYRMSCEHVRVGSFGAITRVCQIGWGGRFVLLLSPPSSSVIRARKSPCTAGGLVQEIPTFCKKHDLIPLQNRCEF